MIEERLIRPSFAMTSPPAQPTIADAARLMDSLSTLPNPSQPSRRCALTLKGSMRHFAEAGTSSHPIVKAQEVSYTCRPDHPSNSLLQQTSLHDLKPATTAAGQQEPAQKVTVPSLPAEIVFHIATFLLPTSPSTSPFPCKHCSPPYTALAPAGSSIAALLSLSSASRSFRNTLLPLIWHTIVIRTPQHLPRLSALLKNYDTLSVRSLSPSSGPLRTSSSPSPTPDPSKVGLRHPLPHIKSIIISIPDKYLDFDQSFLLSLLRSLHLTRTQQLEHLSWSAEAVPNPAIWPLLSPSLKSLEVDGRTFYQGHKGIAGLERLESLRFTGYESTLLPNGVVALLKGDRGCENLGDEWICQDIERDANGLDLGRGRRQSPIEDLQRSSTSPPRRQAQGLYLDPPPSSHPSLATSSSFPPHSPTTSRTCTRLKHLSLSSSKTSLLHHPSLLPSLSLHPLTCLDIYAITPSPPLPSTILLLSSTLTHLRLILDISGAFSNYNSLWFSLTSHLPSLIWLQVDPMPQQNTAPSFWDFVQSCGRLEWINGRRRESFPPCFGGFDPDHSSGALPF